MNALKIFFRKYRILLTVVLFAIVFNACQDQELTTIEPRDDIMQSTYGVIPGKYIVVLKERNFDNLRTIDDYRARTEIVRNISMNILAANNIDVENLEHVYSVALQGFAAEMSDSHADLLRQDPGVKYVEQDQFYTLAPPGRGKPGGGGDGDDDTPTQTTPWGIKRVNGGVAYSGNVAWIIDTGIDLDHPDLNVDVRRSVSFLGGRDAKDPDDAHGHGTHVAGTVAAINNSIGVIGVAAGATVISVRVLDRRGSGTVSGVIAGVDHVAGNGSSGDVANMSLGGGYSLALNDAVINASAKVKFAIAAGNSSDDAINYSPASASYSYSSDELILIKNPNIFTVSAMSFGDLWASFSNFGPWVNYCVPGVGVESTWKKGGYKTISGTSMAAPHIAGVLLLGNISTDGLVNGDPDGEPDPIGVHIE